jgi:hypothetical protein
MTDLTKTKQLFDGFKIPYTIEKVNNHDYYKTDLIILSIVNDNSTDGFGGYDGFEVDFLFEAKDERFFKMCICE